MSLRAAVALRAAALAAALALMSVATACRDAVRLGPTTGASEVDAARSSAGRAAGLSFDDTAVHGPAGDAARSSGVSKAEPTDADVNKVPSAPATSATSATSSTSAASAASATSVIREGRVGGEDARSRDLPTPEPLGGAWVTCYGNFRPTSTPERDVTRLGLLCGPANGMRMVGTTTVAEATDVANEHPFVARRGECFRVFAVASATVADLAVEVRDAKRLPIAGDHSGDRYPIVNPDGPFCLFDGGTYMLRVRARKGTGRYALQLWRLPYP